MTASRHGRNAGLQPGTKYYYQVGDFVGNTSAQFHFTTLTMDASYEVRCQTQATLQRGRRSLLPSHAVPVLLRRPSAPHRLCARLACVLRGNRSRRSRRPCCRHFVPSATHTLSCSQRLPSLATWALTRTRCARCHS
ncbi:hypothetical protein EON66_12435 [archaeon]|nr:MAG: hypothetical protein EON66_12435 [archaeon]